MRLFIGGMRGSRPVTGGGFEEFGGDTTSLLVVGSQGERLIFDAGTGMNAISKQLAEMKPGEVTILFSHYHSDHVIGLVMNPLFYQPDWSFTFTGPSFPDGGVREVVTRHLSPPNWPVSYKQMKAQLDFADFDGREIRMETLLVRGCPIPHPGGSMAYRIDDTQDKSSLVFVTDMEWRQRTQADEVTFIKLCCEPKPAEMLIIDAHYSNVEIEAFTGWGHTSWEDALELAERLGVKHVLLGHHASEANDKILNERERQVKKRMPGAALARAGQWLTV